MSDHAVIAIIASLGAGVQMSGLVLLALQLRETRRETREELRLMRRDSRRMARLMAPRQN
jgi:hypothetical protein